MFATTPPPPCYAVIFSARRRAVENEVYEATAARMIEQGAQQNGFFGLESAWAARVKPAYGKPG